MSAGGRQAAVARVHAQQISRGQLASFSCPRVRPDTPEFLNDLTNHESDPVRLSKLYSTRVGPRTSTTAQDFYRTRVANGRFQFIPQIQQDIGDQCIKRETCNASAEYRAMDGSCNNLQFPEWGVAGSALVRIFPAFYSDGKHSLRETNGGSGEELPSPRLLLTSVLTNSTAPDSVTTYVVMSWGQLVSHDTSRIMDEHVDGSSDQCLCCTTSHKEIASSLRSTSCLPIKVPLTDSFYSKRKVSCLNFMRSMTTDNMKCIISPVQMVTGVTHFVDASFLYGSTDRDALKLRSFIGGLLRFQTVNGEQFMPDLAPSNHNCPLSDICFNSGDDRVNQNPVLAVLQTIFLRFHNLVAKQLKKLNTHWSDEKTYQETRRIVVGVFQRITYSEYLPVIINQQVLIDKKLTGTSGLALNEYDQFLNPGTLVSFTSAAYRVFHSMVPSDIKLFSENRDLVKVFLLSNVFFKPDLIQQKDMFDNFVRGLTFQPAQKLNLGYTDQVTNLLFKINGQMGLDLVSADIMRGRDHGLPGYVLVRLSCGLSRPTDFAGLRDIMSGEAVERLSHTYASVDDIDLYIGALLEPPAPGSLVGPTLQCIIVEQFRRWKDGDRYFYTFMNNAGPFSGDQLNEVEKMTLAKLACLVSKIQTIQPQAFRQPDLGENKLTACSSFSQMDFGAWLDTNG